LISSTRIFSKRNGSTLILPGEVALHSAIYGIVRDESGSPLERISMTYGEMDDSEEERKWIRTGDDGSFLIPALKDRFYRIFFPDPSNYDVNGRYYKADDLTYVAAGSNLNITMIGSACLKVRTRTLKDRYGPPFEYDAWLENENGQVLEVENLCKWSSSVYFFDTPAGMVRAVVAIHGVQYQTPLFEMPEGKSLRIGNLVPWELRQ